MTTEEELRARIASLESANAELMAQVETLRTDNEEFCRGATEDHFTIRHLKEHVIVDLENANAELTQKLAEAR